MVNFNIYFAYFHFALVSLYMYLIKLIKSNQVIIMLYVYMYVVYFAMHDFVLLILLLSNGHHDWFNKVFLFLFLLQTDNQF
jgi:hypothetical protein